MPTPYTSLFSLTRILGLLRLGLRDLGFPPTVRSSSEPTKSAAAKEHRHRRQRRSPPGPHERWAASEEPPRRAAAGNESCATTAARFGEQQGDAAPAGTPTGRKHSELYRQAAALHRGPLGHRQQAEQEKPRREFVAHKEARSEAGSSKQNRQ